jgi:hypothetical protein
MFCQKCGTPLGGAIAACPSCNTPIIAGTAGSAGAAPLADTVKATSRDALAAFKTFALNPVAGLPQAYQALGDAKALRAGVAFGVLSLACFLLGGYMLLPEIFKQDLFEFLGFGGVMKCLLFGVVPFLCTAAGGLAVRKALGGQGTLGSDAFIAGAAVLPASICILLSGMVGLGNFEIIGILSVFAGCTGVLTLFSGYTRIAKLSERAGTLAVPVVVILAVWLAKVIASSVMDGPGGGGDMSGFYY